MALTSPWRSDSGRIPLHPKRTNRLADQSTSALGVSGAYGLAIAYHTTACELTGEGGPEANAEEPSEVTVGIEIDRGLLVGAITSAGYAVHAINPLSVDRYRDRHRTSGAKSDPGDARVLADLVRTDRHLHRRVPGDSEAAEAMKVLARAHQGRRAVPRTSP